MTRRWISEAPSKTVKSFPRLWSSSDAFSVFTEQRRNRTTCLALAAHAHLHTGMMAAMTTDTPGQAIVEAAWRDVRNGGGVRTELIDAAYAEPRLRELFPWTGMGELHFSRCTGNRWTWDIPYIGPTRDGGYCVEGPLRTETVGSAADAAQAVAMVVERLPANCGPAFIGTPEELAAHEAKG
ncbi:DUF6193 family natural product biosynthesis protein [Actinocorallia aurantiaca]